MKKMILAVVCIVLSLVLCACGAEKIVWEDMVLGDLLPEPPVNKGKLYTNAMDELWLTLEDCTDKQFADYIKACEAMGYTVDKEVDNTSFDAYNAEGYKLSLSHYGSNASLSIDLEAPVEMETISWPTGTAGQKLPAPESLIGKFAYEYDDNFRVYIGETTKVEYDKYVDACVEMGFDVDYSKDTKYYRADNAEGWHIDLSYEGYNTMCIYIDAPDEEDVVTTPADEEPTSKSADATTPETTVEPIPETTEATASGEKEAGLGAEFKAAMDSYEEFMDEYIAFMEKYEQNPSDFGLLADYAKFMTQYTEFAEDFEKWESEEMNEAETAYYIEVQTRVNEKLLNALQ